MLLVDSFLHKSVVRQIQPGWQEGLAILKTCWMTGRGSYACCDFFMKADTAGMRWPSHKRPHH